MNAAQPGRRGFALAVVVGISVTCAVAAGPACGGALWRMLTLSDDGATRVQLSRTPTTIAEIAKLKPPARIGLARSTDFQQHVWRLQVVVDRYRIASNGEIVLVLYSIDSAQYIN